MCVVYVPVLGQPTQMPFSKSTGRVGGSVVYEEEEGLEEGHAEVSG